MILSYSWHESKQHIFLKVYLKGYNFEQKRNPQKKEEHVDCLFLPTNLCNLVQFVQLNICSNTNNPESTHTCLSVPGSVINSSPSNRICVQHPECWATPTVTCVNLLVQVWQSPAMSCGKQTPCRLFHPSSTWPPPNSSYLPAKDSYRLSNAWHNNFQYWCNNRSSKHIKANKHSLLKVGCEEYTKDFDVCCSLLGKWYNRFRPGSVLCVPTSKKSSLNSHMNLTRGENAGVFY